MSKMIHVRHVPDDLHRTLKVRAAQAGMSLSDYILRELKKIAEVPTRQELLERLRKLPRRRFSPSPTEILREERDSR